MVLKTRMTRTMSKTRWRREQTAAQAVAAGLGVVLLPKFLTQNELDWNELVVVFEQPMKSENGYYLVTPDERVNYAPVVAFREWLLHQVAIT